VTFAIFTLYTILYDDGITQPAYFLADCGQLKVTWVYGIPSDMIATVMLLKFAKVVRPAFLLYTILYRVPKYMQCGQQIFQYDIDIT
jgi:hypothetical protein